MASIGPDLIAIILAFKNGPGPGDENQTLLTLLQSVQRRGFPLWLCRHRTRQLLVCMTTLMKRQSAVVTSFMTAKAQRCEQLNEEADALAGTVAEMES